MSAQKKEKKTKKQDARVDSLLLSSSSTTVLVSIFVLDSLVGLIPGRCSRRDAYRRRNDDARSFLDASQDLDMNSHPQRARKGRKKKKKKKTHTEILLSGETREKKRDAQLCSRKCEVLMTIVDENQMNRKFLRFASE